MRMRSIALAMLMGRNPVDKILPATYGAGGRPRAVAGRRGRALVWAVLAAMVASATADAQAAVKRSEEELVVRSAYSTLAKLSAGGGHQLGFRLTNFRHVEPAEFGRVRWLDVVTMPGGLMVDVTRTGKTVDGTVVAVTYAPAWKEAETAYLTSAEGQRLAGMSVGAVLALRAAEEPEFANVTGITTFNVKVAFDKRSRAYKAAVVWFAGDGSRDASITFVDNITQGLEQAALEPPVRYREIPRAELLEKVDPGKQCVATRLILPKEALEMRGTNGHGVDFSSSPGSPGYHIARAKVDFICSCDIDCNSTCTARFAEPPVCSDSGVVPICHKMSSNSDLGLESDVDSTVAGGGAPGCAAGFSCHEKGCLACLCGLTVGVSAHGTTVSFSQSGPSDWGANFTFKQQSCPPCQEVIPPPPPGGGGIDPGGPLDQDPPPPDGGSGGGGGGGSIGCCLWQDHCYFDSNGIYTCTPICGQWCNTPPG